MKAEEYIEQGFDFVQVEKSPNLPHGIDFMGNQYGIDDHGEEVEVTGKPMTAEDVLAAVPKLAEAVAKVKKIAVKYKVNPKLLFKLMR